MFLFRQVIMQLSWEVEAQTQLKPSLMEDFAAVSSYFSRQYSDHHDNLEGRVYPLSVCSGKTVGLKQREVYSV